ncbi:MAG TPA: hypothetical protein VFQ51_18325, partial [Vicinamibacteria bacterium]|nr:hypothetical protein [Vicinamibacteria bacterium]
LGNLAVNGLAIDPVTTSTLYASTWGPLFRSTNGGGSWSPAGNGLPSEGLSGVVVHSTMPATVYAAVYGSGVYRSTDAGATWSPVNDGLTDLRVMTLALDPEGTSTLYAGLLDGGVWQASPPTPVELLTFAVE